MQKQPSRRSLQDAHKLGRLMAIHETRLFPLLGEARKSVSFGQFAVEHRQHLEQLPAFERWDVALQRIIESEGVRSRLPLDDSKAWNLFYTSFAATIRLAFWCGWEEVYGLRRLYDQHREARRAASSAGRVLVVGNEPMTPVFPSTEMPANAAEEREGLAADLVDQLDADDAEQPWTMPSPEQVAPHDPNPAA